MSTTNRKKKPREFTSITIHSTKFDKIKRIADARNQSAAKFVEDLVDYYIERGPIALRAHNDIQPTTYRTEVTWKGAVWARPYVEIITDPTVRVYRSTAWVRSKEYVIGADSPAAPQWGPRIMARLDRDRDFRIMKIFVISAKAWDAKEVWVYVSHWSMANLAYGGRVEYFIVKEEQAREEGINKKYFDMGLYGNQLVGYLDLDEKSTPLQYHTESLPESKIKEALEQFERLRRLRLPLQAYREKLLPEGS